CPRSHLDRPSPIRPLTCMNRGSIEGRSACPIAGLTNSSRLSSGRRSSSSCPWTRGVRSTRRARSRSAADCAAAPGAPARCGIPGSAPAAPAEPAEPARWPPRTNGPVRGGHPAPALPPIPYRHIGGADMMPERDEQQREQIGRLIQFPGAPESQVPARSGSDGSPQTESTEVAPQQGAAYEAEVQRRRDRRRATRSRVLRSSQAIVGRVRVVATSPTTRERARRLRRRLVDEVRLIGQGVHMVCRRCTVEGQLRRYYEGNNPNGRLRP